MPAVAARQSQRAAAEQNQAAGKDFRSTGNPIESHLTLHGESSFKNQVPRTNDKALGIWFLEIWFFVIVARRARRRELAEPLEVLAPPGES
jgi:hypothetical protein